MTVKSLQLTLLTRLGHMLPTPEALDQPRETAHLTPHPSNLRIRKLPLASRSTPISGMQPVPKPQPSLRSREMKRNQKNQQMVLRS